jgi:hypothetical protein
MENNKMSAEEISNLFKSKSDCYADTWIFENDGSYREGKVIQAMTESVFIKLMSEQTTSLQKQIEELRTSLATSERFRIEDASSAIDEANMLRDELSKVRTSLLDVAKKATELKSQLSQKDEMLERMAEALIKLNDYFFCEKPLDDGEYYDLIKSTENVILQYQNSKK